VRAAAAGLVRSLEFFPTWMITLRRGDTVIVGARALGLLGIFADRVISERDEGDDARGAFAAGFTYATLEGHFETGVEAFLARRESEGAPVVFTIDAISRAAALWKKAGSRIYVRGLQRRFGRDATARFAELLAKRLSA
jgi:uncharacterized protein (UPF0548 family)